MYKINYIRILFWLICFWNLYFITGIFYRDKNLCYSLQLLTAYWGIDKEIVNLNYQTFYSSLPAYNIGMKTYATK